MRLSRARALWSAYGSLVSRLLCLLLGSLCAKGFVINPQYYIGKSSVPAAVTDYLWAFLALALAWLFHRVYVVARLRPRWGEALFGLLFGVLNYFCATLFAYDSWAFAGVLISWPAIAVKCLGQGFAMTALLTGVSAFLTRGGLRHSGPAPQHGAAPRADTEARLFPRLRALYSARTTLFCAAFFLFCWLPYLVAFFPGTVISDSAWMFEQYIGLTPMTTWHSVFTTYFLGGCVSLGRLLGSDGLGCFLYTLCQSLLLAYAFGRVMRLLRGLRAGRAWQLGVMAFFGLLPIWGCYAQMVGKDTFYTASMLILFLQLMELRLSPDAPRAADWLRLFFSALLCCLWRNNGFYVVLPTALMAVLALARGRARLRAGAALGAALALFLLFDRVLTPSLGVVNASSSGIYSTCFQQTARVVREHRAELTPEELQQIDKTLAVDEIAGLYEPWISDPVKYTYRQFGAGEAVEKAALAEFRQTWLGLVRRFPVTCLQAFLANNSGYYTFTPKYIGYTYSQQAGARFYYTPYPLEGEGQLRTTQPPALQPLRELLSAASERLWTFPVASLLYGCAPYTWLLVAAAISLCHQGRWRDLWLFVPLLFSFAVCLLSPVNDYIRYFLPVIACGVPLLAYAGVMPRDRLAQRMDDGQNRQRIDT